MLNVAGVGDQRLQPLVVVQFREVLDQGQPFVVRRLGVLRFECLLHRRLRRIESFVAADVPQHAVLVLRDRRQLRAQGRPHGGRHVIAVVHDLFVLGQRFEQLTLPRGLVRLVGLGGQVRRDVDQQLREVPAFLVQPLLAGDRRQTVAGDVDGDLGLLFELRGLVQLRHHDPRPGQRRVLVVGVILQEIFVRLLGSLVILRRIHRVGAADELLGRFAGQQHIQRPADQQ